MNGSSTNLNKKSTKSFILAGIGTEVGKTVISAILVEALKLDYWKPVQAGELDYTDSNKVRAYISNAESVIHPEGYRLLHPMSPHAAAAREGMEVAPQRLQLPASERGVLVELAGGLMVPLTPEYMNMDLITDMGLPVVLVSQYYLGSINHTLLSIEILKARNIPIMGIIFNGEKNQETQDVILSYSGIKLLGEVPQLRQINKNTIKKWGMQFNDL